MKKDEIIYQLSVEDIQTVAEDLLDRELNAKELKMVIDRVGDYIPWYNSIENTLMEFDFESKTDLNPL